MHKHQRKLRLSQKDVEIEFHGIGFPKDKALPYLHMPLARANLLSGWREAGAGLRASAKPRRKNMSVFGSIVSAIFGSNAASVTGGRFTGTFSIRGLGEGHFGALSIHSHGG